MTATIHPFPKTRAAGQPEPLITNATVLQWTASATRKDAALAAPVLPANSNFPTIPHKGQIA